MTDTQLSLSTLSRVGAGGRILLPWPLRRKFGIRKGRLIVAEERPDGILIRPALSGIEIYTPRRKAEFLLSNASDEKDYRAALAEVRKMGVNPADLPHANSRPSCSQPEVIRNRTRKKSL